MIICENCGALLEDTEDDGAGLCTPCLDEAVALECMEAFLTERYDMESEGEFDARMMSYLTRTQ